MEPEIYYHFQPALDTLEAEDITTLAVDTTVEPYTVAFQAKVSQLSYDFVVERIRALLSPYAAKAILVKPGTQATTFVAGFWPKK